MHTLIISQTEFFLQKESLESLMFLMRDVTRFASEVKVNKGRKRTKVFFSFVTQRTEFLNSFISRLADHGYRFDEKRYDMNDLHERFLAANEFSVWRVSEFHRRDYGKLTLKQFKEKRGKVDLSLYNRIFEGAFKNFAINDKKITPNLLRDVYKEINSRKPGGLQLGLGDIIQIQNEYYYIDRGIMEMIQI